VNYLYTCIIDNYDQLKEVSLPVGWEAICFSNTDIVSKTWKIVRIEKSDKIYREIKIRPDKFLPSHDKSVWIDGNLEFIIPFEQFVKGKDGFWLMTHPDRNCIYEEALRCIELKKDSEEVIRKQMFFYAINDYPKNNGLSATGVLIRDSNIINFQFGEYWWKEIESGSIRDQLSFPYVARLHSLKFKMFPFLEGFQYHYHVPRQLVIKAKAMRRRRFKAKRVRGYDKL